MIRQAVILAAGMGQRIRVRDDDLPKPLQPVGGVPLIKRTILTLAAAGIERVHVIVGFMADRVVAALTDEAASYAAAGVVVDTVHNPDFHLANGVSLLHARGRVEGPFVLSMSDHVYDPSIARAAAGAGLHDADLVLCVDRRITEVYDLDDATKVATDGGRILRIGKDLREFDAIDCGVFAVAPAFFDHLEAARAPTGDCSLSQGVTRLTASGRARVVDVGAAFWQDVDTPEARARAEEILRDNL